MGSAFSSGLPANRDQEEEYSALNSSLKQRDDLTNLSRTPSIVVPPPLFGGWSFYLDPRMPSIESQRISTAIVKFGSIIVPSDLGAIMIKSPLSSPLVDDALLVLDADWIFACIESSAIIPFFNWTPNSHDITACDTIQSSRSPARTIQRRRPKSTPKQDARAPGTYAPPWSDEELAWAIRKQRKLRRRGFTNVQIYDELERRNPSRTATAYRGKLQSTDQMRRAVAADRLKKQQE